MRLQTEAVAAYNAVDLAHTSSGQRVDILMSNALAHLFAEEYAEAKAAIDAANAYVHASSWDKRTDLHTSYHVQLK